MALLAVSSSLYNLALISIKQGVDKIRLNPGNISNKEKIVEIVNECKKRHIPIRIGVNKGSLEKDLQDNNELSEADKLVESALRHIKIFEEYNFSYLIRI